MSLFTREFLVDMLSDGAIIVKFTKVDGSARVMRCTRDPDLVPVDSFVAEENPEKPIKENLNVLRVYDLDIAEWRSFRIANVKSVSLTEDL